MVSKVETCLSKIRSGKSPDLIEIFEVLRTSILSTSETIVEESKWGMPHYSYKGLMIGIGVFKNHVSVWFHKGTLMSNSYQLFMNGEDNKGMRQIQMKAGDLINIQQFTSYVKEAIDINEKGLKIAITSSKKTNALIESVDFISILKKNNIAFDFYNTLTNVQKRNFQKYIVEAKQESTRQKRITRAVDRLQNNLKSTY